MKRLLTWLQGAPMVALTLTWFLPAAPASGFDRAAGGGGKCGIGRGMREVAVPDGGGAGPRKKAGVAEGAGKKGVKAAMPVAVGGKGMACGGIGKMARKGGRADAGAGGGAGGCGGKVPLVHLGKGGVGDRGGRGGGRADRGAGPVGGGMRGMCDCFVLAGPGGKSGKGAARGPGGMAPGGGKKGGMAGGMKGGMGGTGKGAARKDGALAKGGGMAGGMKGGMAGGPKGGAGGGKGKAADGMHLSKGKGKGDRMLTGPWMGADPRLAAAFDPRAVLAHPMLGMAGRDMAPARGKGKAMKR